MINDLHILILKKPLINQNQIYKLIKHIFKEMSKLIDYLKDNFQYFENTNSDIHKYEFKYYGNNYLWKIECNFKIYMSTLKI